MHDCPITEIYENDILVSQYLDYIKNLYITNTLTNNSKDDMNNFNLAVYYEIMNTNDEIAKYNISNNETLDKYVANNDKLIEKYYMMSIEQGNDDAMFNLGTYYYINKKNYELMKKYYLMAIEKDNCNAMFYLGEYYEHIEKNYYFMTKYYMMTIEKYNMISFENKIKKSNYFVCYSDAIYSLDTYNKE